MEIRTISRPLKNCPSKLGALRHDAAFVRTKNGEQHILERMGWDGATDDVKLRKVIPREQSMSVPYSWWRQDDGLAVDGFGSDVSTRVTMDLPEGGLGPYPYLLLPPITWKSSGEGNHTSGSSKIQKYVRETTFIEVELEDLESNTIESWLTQAKSNYLDCNMKLYDLHREAKEHVRKYPYSLGKNNCHELIRHLNDVAGINNKAVPSVDFLMYRTVGSMPSISSVRCVRQQQSLQEFQNRILASELLTSLKSDQDFAYSTRSAFLHLPHILALGNSITLELDDTTLSPTFPS